MDIVTKGIVNSAKIALEAISGELGVWLNPFLQVGNKYVGVLRGPLSDVMTENHLGKTINPKKAILRSAIWMVRPILCFLAPHVAKQFIALDGFNRHIADLNV